MATTYFFTEKKTLAKLVGFVPQDRNLSDQSTLKRPTWSPTTKKRQNCVTDTDASAENIWYRCLTTLFTNRQSFEKKSRQIAALQKILFLRKRTWSESFKL